MLKFLLSSATGCAAGACYSVSDSSSASEPQQSHSFAARSRSLFNLSSTSSSYFGSATTSGDCDESNNTMNMAAAAAQCAASANDSAFNPDEWQRYRLVSSKYETHDTRRFFFALPGGAEAKANLPLASCILVRYHDKVEDKPVIRPYTPITHPETKGVFELLVKRYPKSKMGNHIHTLRPGEDIECKGPIMKLEYKPGKYTHIGMLAGGTGITPMFQLIQGIMDNRKPDPNRPRVSLVYSNKTRNDMLLSTELAEVQKAHPHHFHLYMTLTQGAPWRWLGGVGHINKDVVKAFMPKPGEPNTVVLVCGPPPFMKEISGDKDFTKGGVPEQGPLSGLLKELGYTEKQVFKF